MLIAGKGDEDAVSIAEEIKGSGTKIFCVGVGVMFDRGELDAMASSPSSTHVITTKFNELILQVQTLVAAILKGKRDRGEMLYGILKSFLEEQCLH